MVIPTFVNVSGCVGVNVNVPANYTTRSVVNVYVLLPNEKVRIIWNIANMTANASNNGSLGVYLHFVYIAPGASYTPPQPTTNSSNSSSNNTSNNNTNNNSIISNSSMNNISSIGDGNVTNGTN